LASLVGAGARALGIAAADVCSTDAADYLETVRWAAAAHSKGFDGLAYPSKQASGRRAMVLFGDKVEESSFKVDPSYSWQFDNADGFSRLYEFGRSVGVGVLRLI
jgi:hypothetical protein